MKKRKVRLERLIFLLLVIILIGFSFLYFIIKQNDNDDSAINAEEETVYIEPQNYYLAVGESIKVEGLNETDSNEIVSVIDGYITGLVDGETELKTEEGGSVYFYVSDLISKEEVNNDKDYLSCNYYTSEDAAELDQLLSIFIDEAGYETRAGALEAARFLTLRFKFKLNYFYENGRLYVSENSSHDVVDGEGRYYHTGLYLSDDKLDLINDEETLSGPCIWGCNLYEYEESTSKANGLDCSGFISWALLNGGFDVGDLGAGPSANVLDLTDLGTMVWMNEVNMDEVKAGDLIGLDGHIGMIIGISSNDVYIAEAYWVKDLQVRVYSKEELLSNAEWQYIILMDDLYLEDGNYTAMW